MIEDLSFDRGRAVTSVKADGHAGGANEATVVVTRIAQERVQQARRRG